MALLCLQPSSCSYAPGGSLLSGPTLGPPCGTLSPDPRWAGVLAPPGPGTCQLLGGFQILQQTQTPGGGSGPGCSLAWLVQLLWALLKPSVVLLCSVWPGCRAGPAVSGPTHARHHVSRARPGGFRLRRGG